MRALPLFTALIAFAGPDQGSGGAVQEPIAEIVTYRLKEGIAPENAVKAAQQTNQFLEKTGAVLARTLSRDDAGIWTDYILWTSLKAAKATEALALQRPEFQLFFDMMEETTVQLRYAPVLMQMD